MAKAPPCLHCSKQAVLTDGKEVYPHRKDLWQKRIWICRACNATCGCHPGSVVPLGYPADKQTRNARMRLHNERLDPLWKQARKGEKKRARTAVYKLLSERMDLDSKDTHTGMFTIEQCREAWRALGGVTTADLLEEC